MFLLVQARSLLFHLFSSVCSDGWIMVNGKCLLLFSYYPPMLNTTRNVTRTVVKRLSGNITYDAANETCQEQQGTVAHLTEDDFVKVVAYLQLWHYGSSRGHIWLDSSIHLDSCKFIKVSRQQREDDTTRVSNHCGECQTKPNVKLTNFGFRWPMIIF